MTAKYIPGEGEIFKGYVPGVVKFAHVTFGVASANPDVAVDEIEATTLINVTVPIVVLAMWTQIEEGFTASVTLDIGDTGSATRYTSDTTVVPGTTGAILVSATGLAVPYLAAAGDNVLITVGGATVAAGLASVYMQYCELHD